MKEILFKLNLQGRDVQENPTPGNRSEYDYPSSGENYGQSFLCISTGGDQFDLIGQQLMYNQIIVYRRNIPVTFAAKFPVLTDAANQKRIRQAPFTSKAVLKSSGDVKFFSFAKSDKWQKGTIIWDLFFFFFFYVLVYFDEQCFLKLYLSNFKNFYL